MYKVFINKKTITFGKNLNNKLFDNENADIQHFINKKNIHQVLNDFFENDEKENLYFYSPNSVNTAFKAFSEDFKILKAAGGIVQKNNKYLLIFRNNKWDLPRNSY